MDFANLKNRAEQLNPNHWKFWKSRGLENRPEEWAAYRSIMADVPSMKNRAEQLNPNNWKFWKSRGLLDKPEECTALFGALPPGLEQTPKILGMMDLFQSSVTIIGTCAHGVVKIACSLCSVKGALLAALPVAVGLIYWYKPQTEYSKNIAHILWQYGVCAPSSAVKTVVTNDYTKQIGRNIWEYGVVTPASAIKSGVTSDYAKQMGKMIWHYGISTPASAMKVGVIYTESGIKYVAAQMWYYCGRPEE